MLKTTYTKARANFAGLCDEVTKNREVVIIGRRSGESVALIAADELGKPGRNGSSHALSKERAKASRRTAAGLEP